MRVSRNNFAKIVIMSRKFKTGARFKLACVLPIKLLPRRMVLGVIGLNQRSAACNLGVVKQNIDLPFAERNSDFVARVQNCQIPADSRFRRNVQN